MEFKDNEIRIEICSEAKVEIRNSQGRGRGVFALEDIPKKTLVNISSVLVFEAENYSNFAKHTIVDSYSYKWFDGKFALALGLGSIFNHKKINNVGFIRDKEGLVIRYITIDDIKKGEEMFISYGSNLWFDSKDEEEEEENEEENDLFSIKI